MATRNIGEPIGGIKNKKILILSLGKRIHVFHFLILLLLFVCCPLRSTSTLGIDIKVYRYSHALGNKHLFIKIACFTHKKPFDGLPAYFKLLHAKYIRHLVLGC